MTLGFVLVFAAGVFLAFSNGANEMIFCRNKLV